MGSYLEKPETTKKSAFDENNFLEVGSSSMQGWRINQEDAHNSILNLKDNVAFFGLYDGHGGSEVAEYCSQKLPEFLKQLKSFTSQDYETALKEAFMGFDAILLQNSVIEELKQMAQKNLDYDMEDEEIIDLQEEARMSLSEVLQKYKNGTDSEVKLKKRLNTKPTASKAEDPEAGPAASGALSSAAPSSSKPAKANEESEVKSSTSENLVSSSSSALNQNPSPTSTHHTGEKTVTKGDEPQSSSSCSSQLFNGQIPSSSSTSNTATATNATSSTSKSQENSAKIKSSTSNLFAKKDDNDNSSDDEVDPPYKESQNKPATVGAMQNSDSDDEEEGDAYSGDEDYDEDDLEDEEVSGEEDDEDDDDDDEDDDDDDGDDDDDDGLNDAFMNNMETGPGKQSGCTAVVAVLDGRDLYVANAGDSRCVLCRNGKVVEMTADHKPEDDIEFQRIKNAGGRVTLDGRVNGGLNLSRAIGDHGYKMNKSLPPQEQMITAMPDLKKIILQPDDEFMVLACDGIWNYMSNEEVIGFVKHRIDSKKPLAEICEELFDNCLAPNTLGDGTGCDNMTAIIVKFKQTIFDQPDSQTTACKSDTETRKRIHDDAIVDDEESEKKTEPSDKKQKIDEEIAAPSTIDTS